MASLIFFSGEKVFTALIKPMVPMEMRSSRLMPVDSNFLAMYLRKNQNRRKEVSIDEPLNIDWDGNELLLSDILGTDADAVSSDIERDAERAMLHRAINSLEERERSIMRLRFGLYQNGREHTQKEVADLIGISQSYISRLEKRIIRRLRVDLREGF